MSAIIRRAAVYDFGVWLLTLGRERRLRERLLAPVQLKPGDALLDVGCGTGTLAILAQRQVGNAGEVVGIDAAAAMIERARHKAARAGLPVRFEAASADALPFPDAHFDVALCTVTLHHLPRWMRAAALAEMQRVLKPGGRVLLADFVFGRRHTMVSLLHHRHGLKPDDLGRLAATAGLRIADSGPLGMWDLHYVVAVKPDV